MNTTYPEAVAGPIPCEFFNITNGVVDTGQSFNINSTQNGYSGSGSVHPTQTTTYGTACSWVYVVNAGNFGMPIPEYVDVSQSPATVTVGGQCTSPPNDCGQTQGGSCPTVPPPADPPYYGQSCTSPANACGQTNQGTYDCSDVCSATTPPNSQCPAPTASLTANPTSINSGDTSVLTYSSTNATSCNISQGVGSVTPNTQSTVNVTPSSSTTYTPLLHRIQWKSCNRSGNRHGHHSIARSYRNNGPRPGKPHRNCRCACIG